MTTQGFKEFIIKNTHPLLETQQDSDKELTTKFFILARNCATQSHYLHLITDSRSDHIALEKFYTDIVVLIDAYMEAYQGKFGLISKTFPTYIGYLTISEFRGWVEDNREQLTTASELQNMIDEIISLCDSVINQLENLK